MRKAEHMSELVEAGRIPVWTLADRIRKARESADLSQTALAELTGISRRSLSNYEASATTPRRPQLVVIALATGVPVEWLQHGDMGMPRPGGPAGAGTECATKDSNLEPTDYELGQVIELRHPDDEGAAA